jgi:hypothetical protein
MALPLLRDTPMPDDFTFDEALEVARQILAWLDDDPPACKAMRLGFITYAVLELLRRGGGRQRSPDQANGQTDDVPAHPSTQLAG